LGTTGLIAVVTQWRRAETMMVEEVRQHARADKTVQQLRLHQAAEYLANGRAAEGVALLASQLRSAPDNRALAQWLTTELTHRSFPLPLAPALRHERECTLAEFSRDGELVLTVARDNAARVWLAATGQLLSAPMRHDPSVVKGDLVSTGSMPLDACFNADGTSVATASVDGTARIWEARTGQPRTPPLPHPDWVSCARFSPDGRLLATACRDGVVRVWDVAQGTPTGMVCRHAKWVNSVEFSTEGNQLVTAADDRLARIWDVRTGAAIGRPLQHAGVVKMAAFSMDGRKVVTASEDGTARIWMAATGDPVGSALSHGGRVSRAVFSPDGRWVATASADRTARLWDALTGAPASDALRHIGIVRWVEFSPEGQRLVTASEDRTTRVWSVATGQLLLEPIHSRSTVWAARFSPEGRRLVTASADGSAQIWDALPGAMAEMTLPVMSRGQKAWWSPQGDRLLTVTRTARLWYSLTGNPVAAGFPETDVRDARFSPSGSLVAVAGGSGVARVWNGRNGHAVSLRLRHDAAVNSIEFSPDESRVVTASEDGTARLWEVQGADSPVASLPHHAAVQRATFSPDGRFVATACEDRAARVWDAATGGLVVPPLSLQAEVQDVQFSRDGRRLLAVGADATAQVWELPSGQRCGPPLKHDGPVSEAVFTPDSRGVVTASHDWKVRLWDPDLGTLAARPLPHEGVVASLDLCPDGRTLLSATRSGRLELWHDYREFPLSSSLQISPGLTHAKFSPDGFFVITVGSEQIARVLQLPRPESPVPDWFPALAEAMVGWAASSEGDVSFVAPEVLLDFRRRLCAQVPSHLSSGWARWWLADKTQRSISPETGLNLDQYVERVMDQAQSAGRDRLGSLRRAMCRAPDHGRLRARYARMLLETGAAADPAVLHEAEWQSAQAIHLSPEDPGVWLARAALSERAGDTNAAISAIEKVRRFIGRSPAILLEVANFHERLGLPDTAEKSYLEAIAAGQSRDDWSEGSCRLLLRRHGEFLARQGRPAEARVELLRAHGVPPCPSDVRARLVNLDAYYNTGLDDGLDPQAGWWLNLAMLPKGRQVLDGVEFDIRGIVQLNSSRRETGASGTGPDEVVGIPIGRASRRLHFLHSTGGEVAEGTVVAVYRAHLRDGGTPAFPVVYGKDVRTWDDEIGPVPTAARIAWQGRAPGTTRLRVFHTVWDLPEPGQEVIRLDLLSGMTGSAPFVIAVTVE
jgi:WD40 repeat protein/tetratricopeptide (TPR) repeat protein